ncbi:MAG TPA: TadE/TadG family type IV pilus assembly protein [Chloroflexota bacterium]|nr:TadE/TadG family type IV pilus assembly protein [Chloroflexota bacterium]
MESGRGVRRTDNGQSLVELALTLPILLAIIMGIVDVGFVLYASSQVSAASYEGARAGSLFAASLADPVVQNDSSREQVVKLAVTGAMGRLDTGNSQNFVQSTDVVVTYDPSIPSGSWSTRSGDSVVVTVRYRQPVWFSILPSISNNRFQVGGTSRVRIE